MHLLVAHMASCIYVNLVNMKFDVLVPSFHDRRIYSCYFYAKINDWGINCQMLTLLFALTGFRELPYILTLLCNNINQIYANIMHTLVE